MIHKMFIAVAAFVLAFPVMAQAAEIGETIPHSLELKDQSGEVRSFESLSGEKGAVFFFVRSADWCPYCQVQMLDLRKEGGQPIVDLGYNIVTVSYDSPAQLKAFADKYHFEHTMLSDEGSAAIKAFGILNEKFEPDSFAYGVPHPHVYVVSRNKVIQAVLSEEGYKKRPPIESIVEAIKGFNP